MWGSAFRFVPKSRTSILLQPSSSHQQSRQPSHIFRNRLSHWHSPDMKNRICSRSDKWWLQTHRQLFTSQHAKIKPQFMQISEESAHLRRILSICKSASVYVLTCLKLQLKRGQRLPMTALDLCHHNPHGCIGEFPYTWRKGFTRTEVYAIHNRILSRPKPEATFAPSLDLTTIRSSEPSIAVGRTG